MVLVYVIVFWLKLKYPVFVLFLSIRWHFCGKRAALKLLPTSLQKDNAAAVSHAFTALSFITSCLGVFITLRGS